MEESYRKLDGLNQSLLKKILVSPGAFIKQRDKQGNSDEAHFVFGSLVDDMLLSDIDIEDKYYVLKDDSTSDLLKSITRYVYDYLKTSETAKELSVDLVWNSMDSIILIACDQYEYQNRWKNATRIEKVKINCLNYFKSLYAAEGKKIISEEDYYKASHCVGALKTDNYTKKYIVTDKNTELWKHKVISFEYGGLSFKGELDKVFIDNSAKTIQPIDYKTTGSSVYSFNYDFWKFRYDFQSAVYFYGISKDPEVIKLLEKGYKILPFKYIVVEKEMHNPPMIFEVPDSVIKIGWEGGTLSSGREYEGFTHAVFRYIFHSELNKWDYPMEYYQKQHIKIKI
tara:strand:- start:11419 stop:12438 length:1020 start_codon:yes stop_codon:yes gene_type:complete